MLIHTTFNFGQSSQSQSCYTTPNHDLHPTMLHGLTDMLRSNAFTISNPTPRPTFGIKFVYLCLIAENNTFPIMNGLVFIPLSKPQPRENMSTFEKWLLMLHLRTQTCISKSISNGDVRQLFTCFFSKLFCCCRCSSNSTFID